MQLQDLKNQQLQLVADIDLLTQIYNKRMELQNLNQQIANWKEPELTQTAKQAIEKGKAVK